MRHTIRKNLTCLLAALMFSPSAFGQGSQADYDRMNQQRQLTRGKVFRTRVEPHWVHDEKGLWYRVETAPSEFEFVVVDVEHKSRQPAFDHAAVATQLAELTGSKVNPPRLPFDQIVLDKSLEHVYFETGGQPYRVSRETSKMAKCEASEFAQLRNTASPVIRPSGNSDVSIHIKFVNDRDEPVSLFWIDREGRPQSYGTVAAQQSKDQHTYIGHVWLIADGDRNPLAVATGERDGQTVEVTEQSRLDIRFPRSRGRRRGRPGSTAGNNVNSPDLVWRIEIRESNAILVNRMTEEEFPLTQDGNEEDSYTSRVYWSPDSTKVVVLKEHAGENHEIHLIESSPSDQVQPKLHTLRYLKPGDDIRTQKPVLFDVESRRQVAVSDELFSTPWAIGDFRWSDDSTEFFFRYNQRGHQVMRIVGVDASTGETRSVVEDQAETFIDYSRKFNVRYLEDSQELIWTSERDGWNHLYLYDSITGKLKNQITRGEWVVRETDRIDEAKRQIWFRASGIIPGQDPYYIHYCRIDFSGENLVVLTAGDGTHSLSFSPSRKYLIDEYSRVDLPTVHELRDTETGELICELERGDDSRLRETGWKTPERFVAMGRDGETPIYGVIYRPSNFDPSRSYPVIEAIYAGPHGSFVPKSYAVYRRNHALTELGFIVVQIDGMGTSNRSKAFHDVCWQNLGDSGFPDRILWMKAAAETYPYMDLDRVGIFGGSAGGQSALRALLAHGDFYKAAVADCGCHDNRMDKIWWNEQWMGWPVGPHYEEQSNVTNAHKLTGKLLLIVGELDRNVDPASTLQVVNALIKANKDFDFLFVPGGGHGIGSGPYGMRRTQDFFVRHLLGVEPRRASISAER